MLLMYIHSVFLKGHENTHIENILHNPYSQEADYRENTERIKGT